MANSAVEDVVSVVAQIGRDANICSRSSSMLGYADQSRGPARRLLLLPYTTTTHRQHQQQFLRHPNSTYEILQLNPSRKLGMFSVGDGAPRSGRRVIVSDPGQPLMTGSVHPVPAPRLLLLTVWCTVVLRGAVWCCVVPEPTLLCRRLPPSMPLCVQWNLRTFCRN